MSIALVMLMSKTVKTATRAKRNTLRNTAGQFTNERKEALWGYQNDNSIRECDRVAARLLAQAITAAAEVTARDERNAALLTIHRAQAPLVEASIAAEYKSDRLSAIRHGLLSMAAIACLIVGAWACVR